MSLNFIPVGGGGGAGGGTPVEVGACGADGMLSYYCASLCPGGGGTFDLPGIGGGPGGGGTFA